MAESFEDVVKKLGSTVKKPAESKAKAVLAVQMVDKAGKVIDGEGGGAAGAEGEREKVQREEKAINLLQEIANSITGARGGGGSAKDKQKGGLLAGIGSALSGMGIGAGVAMGGMGALFAGGGYLLKQIAEFDGKAVVANVKELLKITELFEGIGDAFVKGGIMLVTFTAIAAGLMVFAAGAAASAGVQYFTKGTKWAETVVKNVTTLIGIQDVKGYDKFKTLEFGAVMLGIATGLVFFAIGEGATSMVQSLTKFSDTGDWAKTVVSNVETLIGIQDIPGYDSFEKAKFLLTMGGIGAGLFIFAIGKAGTSMAESLTKFSDTGDWAKTVVSNVKTLIGIQDIPGYDSFDKGKFLLTMGGIGLGLVAFSVGEAAASATTALTQFSDTGDWAKTVVSNVKTLVGIQDIPGYDSFGKTKFIFTMGAIALGLIAFALGEGATGMAQSLTKFTETGNWAQTIYDNVKTLVSISSIPNIGKDTKTFALVMGGIAAGLVAFSFGKGAAGFAEAITRFSGVGKEGSFADRIKNQVKTLLSILDEPDQLQKSITFQTIMANIAAGLSKFAGGTFLTALAGAAKGVMSFLTGADSPIQQMETIAKNADELKQGAIAIGTIAENLDKVGNLKFKGGDLGIKDFAKDLLKSVPAIETAVMGGIVGEGWIASGTKIKGLASLDINYEEAAKNIRMLRKALNAEIAAAPTSEGVAPAIDAAAFNRRSADAGGGGSTSINTGGNTANSKTTNFVGSGIAARRPIILSMRGGGA